MNSDTTYKPYAPVENSNCIPDSLDFMRKSQDLANSRGQLLWLHTEASQHAPMLWNYCTLHHDTILQLYMRVFHSLITLDHLPTTAHHILGGGQAIGAHGAARVHPTCADPHLRTHPEALAIREARAAVDKH